jgi:hypothetical protein
VEQEVAVREAVVHARLTISNSSPTSTTSCACRFPFVSSFGHRNFHVSPSISTWRFRALRSRPLLTPIREASRNTAAFTSLPNRAWKLAQMARH